MSRDRQLGVFAEDYFERLAAHAAGVVIFRLPAGNFHLSEKPQEWIGTETDSDRKWLSCVEIFLPVDIAVMPRRNIKRQGVMIVHHDAITTKIDPAFIRIAADGNVEGADVAAAIAFVPKRRGQRQDIDVLSLEDVLHHRPRADHSRRNQPGIVQTFFPRVDKLIPTIIERQMISEALALESWVVNAGQDPPARRIVYDLVEQHCGRWLGVRGNFGHSADFLIPMGAFYDSKLPE
jgi:hypothetical protein